MVDMPERDHLNIAYVNVNDVALLSHLIMAHNLRPSNPSTGLRPAIFLGAQWLSGRVLDSRPSGRRFEPHRRHCVVVFEQDTFILA